MASRHNRSFYFFRNKMRLSDFCSEQFLGVFRDTTVTPKGLKGILRIKEDVREFILKKAIVQIVDFPSLCLSPIFVIPKKTGDLRVFLNLKEFNLFSFNPTFTDGDSELYFSQLSAKVWAVSFDLKDIYLLVSVRPESRGFLGFQFMDATYHSLVLPFVLKDSPWVFFRVGATLIGLSRCLGLRTFSGSYWTFRICGLVF